MSSTGYIYPVDDIYPVEDIIYRGRYAVGNILWENKRISCGLVYPVDSTTYIPWDVYPVGYILWGH